MIRRRDLLALSGAFLASAGLGSAHAAGSSPEGAGPAFSAVADGVFVRAGPVEAMTPGNRGGIANLAFVVGGDAVAAIDSGGSPADGAAMVRAIRRVTDKPIRHCVNTHMHPDHIFGNQALKAAGATIVGHRNLAAALAARRESYLLSMRDEIGEDLMRDLVITPPDIGVETEHALDLGGRRLVLTAWETAHTDNDLTAFDEASGILFAGDLCFMEHLPVIDGSLKGWLTQTPALEALRAARVVPGHGPASAPWPAAMEPQTRYLEALAADIRAALARGDTLSETVETAGRGQTDGWRLVDEYASRNATAAFAELEWE